jgi:hypothetical protein
MRMAYADGPWGQIHYRVVAPTARTSRLPLLCLHASPLSGIVYDQWLPEIGRDRLALAPDTPGYGSSAAPPQPPAIADYAAAMLRFIDELGLRQRIRFAVDPNSAAIDALGLRKQDPEPIEAGVPHPTTYLLDREGVIRFVDVRRDFHIWLDPQLVAETLARVP